MGTTDPQAGKWYVSGIGLMFFPKQNITYALSDFSLATPEFNLENAVGIAVAGANGSGKTTWVKALAGLLKQGNPAKEAWFYVPQSMEQFFFAETLSEQLRHLFPDGFDSTKLQKIFSQFGLNTDNLAEYPLHWLSGGERRRVALACALYFEPKYLILDEPTIGLSPKEALVVIRLLDRLQEELSSLLVVTHALDVIQGRSFVLGFEAGKIVYQNTVESLVNSPEMINQLCIRSDRAAR